MTRKQIIWAQKYSRKELLERKNPEISEQKLTLNITYYSTFQNVRSISQEFQLLLVPESWYLLLIPVIGFCNEKSSKDYLIRAALPKTNETARS